MPFLFCLLFHILAALFFPLKTRSHYIVHAGLEIAILCLSFLFVGIIGVFSHEQLVFLLKFLIKLFFSTLPPPHLSLVSFLQSKYTHGTQTYMHIYRQNTHTHNIKQCFKILNKK